MYLPSGDTLASVTLPLPVMRRNSTFAGSTTVRAGRQYHAPAAKAAIAASAAAAGHHGLLRLIGGAAATGAVACESSCRRRSRRSIAISFMDWYRSSGLFARHLRTILCASVGNDGAIADSAAGCS